MGMQSQAMSLMEVTPEMTSLFFVNQDSLERVRNDKASNAVLDVVDDFCDFIDDVNNTISSHDIISDYIDCVVHVSNLNT